MATLALSTCSFQHHAVKNTTPSQHVSRNHFARKRIIRPRQSIVAKAGSPSFQPQELRQEAAQGPKRSIKSFDFVVLGSGIAGLSFALKAAEHGTVAVVTKGAITDGCTQYAQGGVCAVLDAFDSVERHIQDTMVAGAFLNDRRAVEVVCREGAERVLELATLGADFTRNKDGSLHLTREGGHSAKRIVHAADVTGREIERALSTAAMQHENISMFEDFVAVDLVKGEFEGQKACLGVDVLDQKDQSLCRFLAPVTMLATGGAGQLYPLTTNPAVTTGDGMAMAYRAKAQMANMEFVQFHPTALYDPVSTAMEGRAFLISEAVRGEGGRLYNLAGERFMTQYDDRMELATRDIVARSIHDQMQRNGDSHVLLDISHEPSHKILEHFPNIAARCRNAGIDITQDAIPVAPAQHYFCGGVRSGLFGETSLHGLFSCGEVASTGLHGANRLASNSLLEGLVFAHRALAPAVAIAELSHRENILQQAARVDDIAGGRDPVSLSRQTTAWVATKRAELQRLMWENCGIVRSQSGMKEAFYKVATMIVETKAVCESIGVNAELQELYNLVTVGELVLSSALQRKESRGGHYCIEYPLELEEQRREVVIATPLKRRTDLAKVVGRSVVPAMVGPRGAPRSRARTRPPPGPPGVPPLQRPTRELSVRGVKDEG